MWGFYWRTFKLPNCRIAAKLPMPWQLYGDVYGHFSAMNIFHIDRSITELCLIEFHSPNATSELEMVSVTTLGILNTLYDNVVSFGVPAAIFNHQVNSTDEMEKVRVSKWRLC